MLESNNIRFSAEETEGIIQIDGQRRIVFFNQGAEKITGFSAAQALMRDFSLIFSHLAKNYPLIEETLASGKSHSHIALDIACRGGIVLTVSASIMPISPMVNSTAGAMIVMRDKRERQVLYDLLEEKTIELINEKNKLQAIFNSRLEGTFTIDKSCKILTFNRSAERITGYSSAEVMGKKCWQVFDSGFCLNECPVGLTKKALSLEKHSNCREIYITQKDGRKIPVRLTTVPLIESGEEQIGAIDSFQDITELHNLSEHLEKRFRLHNIVGRSHGMEQVYWMIENVAKNDSTILISGESGTGKELVARAIHLNSYRKAGPFIAVNCSAYAESLIESELFGHEKGSFTGAVQAKIGRFETAQGGTLFLDEIGDLSPAVQVKLLRILETRWFERVGSIKSKKLDIRLIAATHKDLAQEVANGRFREDFYYRINVVNIHLPPLRERADDIPLLVQDCIAKFALRFNKSISAISPAAVAILQKYAWPGNVRELENVIEHAFVMCHQEYIDVEHLPLKIIETGENSIIRGIWNGSQLTLEEMEKEMITAALHRYQGNRFKTAKALGIGKATLWRKMHKYNLMD